MKTIAIKEIEIYEELEAKRAEINNQLQELLNEHKANRVEIIKTLKMPRSTFFHKLKKRSFSLAELHKILTTTTPL